MFKGFLIEFQGVDFNLLSFDCTLVIEYGWHSVVHVKERMYGGWIDPAVKQIGLVADSIMGLDDYGSAVRNATVEGILTQEAQRYW